MLQFIFILFSIPTLSVSSTFRSTFPLSSIPHSKQFSTSSSTSISNSSSLAFHTTGTYTSSASTSTSMYISSSIHSFHTCPQTFFTSQSTFILISTCSRFIPTQSDGILPHETLSLLTLAILGIVRLQQTRTKTNAFSTGV
jgi:hypothetical protein